MLNSIGYSVYLSNFEEQKEQLSKIYTKDSYIFTTFHMSEEFDNTYIERAMDMCSYIKNLGFKIIGDVSRKTLEFFQVDSLIKFAKQMNLSILRIDYGFTEEEILELAEQMPICINASTVTDDFIHTIASKNLDVYGIHNFYPRPETGLDEELFRTLNKKLKENGIKVLAFAAGDISKRGPVYEGLPTLEAHRYTATYAATLDLLLNYGVDGVFIGDGIISKYQADLIFGFIDTNIINLPVEFNDMGKELYEKEFTIRVDSPRWLKRLQESREYSCFGREITPEECKVRSVGSVTIDNISYQRYSGEIQIIVEELPADEKVNVIGHIPKEYHILLKSIKNGTKIRFVKPI
ncbi:hypothetical protein EDD66_10348 [Mobilisporobacter senegalensis]|uniref:Outer surface protein n=1 Tax=Mobilisporobacter senegalensis TaxID=1329262 RepID=A0A3N1XR15_9FIRM|nr:MupG family TIM beta-alpha barrel fold protein [Mobilisporobacter senegalensis]ROR29113.1 hypothetical protein EDD66_10348 [Mobilisporobacter senegalensis]